MKPIMKAAMACGLLLGMFSVQNAWGYTYECVPNGGTPKQIIASFGTYTITDPTQNTAGQEFDGAATWNVGSSVKITCDEPASYHVRRFSATSPLPPTTNDGHQWYHVNESLDATIALAIKGADHYVPFTNVKGGNAMDNRGNSTVTGGGTGHLDLRFLKPVMGTTSFNNIHVADIFISKSTEVMSSGPVSQLYLSGTVAVPQNCTINADTVIHLDLGKMYSSDFTTAGEKPNNVTPKSFNVPVSCNYGASLANLTLRMVGTPSTQYADALQTDNPDVGVRVTDSNGVPLSPADPTSTIPLSLDMVDSDTYTENVTLQAYPISTTGIAPEEGTFTALALLRVDFA